MSSSSLIESVMRGESSAMVWSAIWSVEMLKEPRDVIRGEPRLQLRGVKISLVVMISPGDQHGLSLVAGQVGR
jgi:hypothetical protein